MLFKFGINDTIWQNGVWCWVDYLRIKFNFPIIWEQDSPDHLSNLAQNDQ